MKRKVLCGVFAALMLLCTAAPAYASAYDPRAFEEDPWRPITIEEQRDMILQSGATSAQKQQGLEKLALAQRAQLGMTPFATFSGTILVCNHGQQEHNWCGPAAMEQCVHYLVGNHRATSVPTTNTQKAVVPAFSGNDYYIQSGYWDDVKALDASGNWIASYTKLISALNIAQKRNQYVLGNLWVDQRKSLMMDYLTFGIRDYDAPPIIITKPTTGRGWTYNSQITHYVSCHYVNTYTDQVGASDPWIKYWQKTSPNTADMTDDGYHIFDADNMFNSVLEADMSGVIY